MQVIHYILIVAGALATGLPVTAAAFPEVAKPWFLGAAAVCALTATVCGALSPPANEKALTRMLARMKNGGAS